MAENVRDAIKSQSKGESVRVAYLVSLNVENRILKELHDMDVDLGNTKAFSKLPQSFVLTIYKGGSL